MTAASQEQIRPVARPLLRTFWTLHRAMYRLTGGRMGLQSPERGAKFGMLRLHTVGRRSGKARQAMIGYFEDGGNLVTLAMNGWGKAEPAWWLNLQTDPTATVDLSGGTRVVRARAATGAERERLWATFRDYPGWGSDIGALASHRPGETAIVVLEPVGAIGSSTETPHAYTPAIGPAAEAAGEGKRRRLRWRHLWIVPGLAVAVYANQLGNANGVGILALIGFGIAPDLPRLLRLGRRPVDSIPVQAFNVLHHPVAAIAAVAVGLTGVVPAVWLVGSLVWLGHLIIGWGVGDVPQKGAAHSHG
jgi:deazaflavin-dependent oxidoreductase (nitroreductase family)